MLGAGLDINLDAAIEGERLDELAILKIREEDEKQRGPRNKDREYESAIIREGTDDGARLNADKYNEEETDKRALDKCMDIIENSADLKLVAQQKSIIRHIKRRQDARIKRTKLDAEFKDRKDREQKCLDQGLTITGAVNSATTR